MIGVIAAIIGGFIIGIKTTLLSPLVYLSSKLKKDVFLISFSAYCISLGYELELGSVYSSKALMVVFSVILPTILLLEDVLGERQLNVRRTFIILPIILAGVFIRELFILGINIVLLYYFFEDGIQKKSFLVFCMFILLFIFTLILNRNTFNMLGSSSTQVVFILAINIFIFIILSKLLTN